MPSTAFDGMHLLGIVFVIVMTTHSIGHAKDGTTISEYNKNEDTAYTVKCQHTMNVYNPDTDTTTETTIYGINHGDTALMMFGTTLVMFQTPAMGIAQAGMIRRKNSLSMMMQCTSGMAIGSLLWYVIGYSLTFGPDVGGIIGDPWPFLFFRDMPRSDTECLAVAPSIPGPLFASFQMMFALMTPVIVTGAWAEKLKMEAFVLFMVFWPLLVYYPIAHWIWGGGWMYEMGCLDFAGGITIHTTAGVAAMVISLMLKPRRNVEKLVMTHHDISLLVIGGTIIWAGWYSFNGCSALVGGASAGAALLNTHLSASVSGLTWVLLTYRRDGCFHVTDMFNGAFAGLAGVTPGSGFIPSQAAFCYGIIIGTASWWSSGFLKNKMKIDDVLDVFSLQAVPGAIGSILVGVFAGGEPYGIDDTPDTLGLAWGGNGRLLGVQIFCVLVAAVETAIATFGLMKCIEATVGLELTVQEEDEGLDKTQIGEIGYDYTSPHDTMPMDEGDMAAHLIEAAANGNLGKCKKLVLAGANINRGDYDKRTALHLAAAEGRINVCEWLVSKAKDMKTKAGEASAVSQIVNAVDSFGCTPIQGAMESGHTSIVKLLKSHGGKVSDESKFVFMLCQTAASGDVAKLKSLVENQNLDVNSFDYDQRSALHVAAAAGRPAAVAYLLQKKASSVAKDRWGQTPADGAAIGACRTILQNPNKDWTSQYASDEASGATVLKNGVQKINPEDGQTMSNQATKEMLDAASSGDLKLVKNLVTKGADCSEGDYDRRTALHIACANGHQAMVKFLLRQKSTVVNCADRFGISPLDEASKKKNEAICQLLKKHGATAMTSSSGFTLCTAAASNNQAKLEELQMSGVDLSAADYDGRTALHLAVSEGHGGIVTWLLETGEVSINVVDRLHHTPLDDALNSVGKDKEEIAAAIRAAGGSTWGQMCEAGWNPNMQQAIEARASAIAPSKGILNGGPLGPVKSK